MKQSGISKSVIMLASVFGMAIASVSLAGGLLHGRGTVMERVKGMPMLGTIEVYESNLFVTYDSNSVIGPYRRLGISSLAGDQVSCNMNTIVGDGRYCIENVLNGTHSAYINQPDFFIRPVVVPEFTMVHGTVQELNIEMPVEYSMYFKGDTDSIEAGLANEWIQTFTATGTSITGVVFDLKNTWAAQAKVSVYEDNGNPNPTQWTFLGMRNEPQIGPVTDNWVRWRSGEIPTTPGKKYAIKVAGFTNFTAQPISPFARMNYGMPTDIGLAYDGNGNPQNFRLNYIVFGDNDGTVMTVNKRTGGVGDLIEGNFSTKWGQTFTATAGSLAAVDCWAAGDQNQWDIDFKWRIREGGPNGLQIGQTRITSAAAFGAGVALHGVSYQRGEIPLVPGQTYFIEFEAHLPPSKSPGFNPLITDDPYDGGVGYFWDESQTQWVEKPFFDVSMTVMEYVMPVMELSTHSITQTAYLGDTPTIDHLLITNVGMNVLNYNITDNVDWLTVTPSSGESAGETDAVSLVYDVTGFAKGTYQALLTISDPGAANSPQFVNVTLNIVTVAPDLDGDTDVDQEDFGMFQNCYSGEGNSQLDPACLGARLDTDDDVDNADFVLFSQCMTGANIPAAIDCMD